MLVLSLTCLVVEISQSIKQGSTAERGFSPRSIVVVMPATLVTNRYATVNVQYNYIECFLPAGGMRRDVATRLVKVGESTGTGGDTATSVI